jgi:hypothetical protein
MKLFLDTIQWVTSAPEFQPGYYRHPDMLFDLRGPAAAAVPADPTKYVLCGTEGALPGGPNVVPIGEATDSFPLARRLALKTVLGIGEAITATTVPQFLLELLVNLADPTGATRWKPLRVGRGRELRLRMAGLDLRRIVPVSHPEWWQTRDVERLSYAQWRADVRAGLMPPEQHLKALAWLAEKYDVDYHEFLGGLPDEGIRQPSTTLTDTFTDTNGVDLEAHTGESGGWSVTNIDTAEIQSNQLVGGVISSGACRLNANLSGDDHYSQLDREADGATSQLSQTVVRMATADLNNFYRYTLSRDATVTHRLYKQVSGTPTQIGSNVDESGLTNPLTQRLEVDGSNLTGKVNGSTKINGTDTDLTGQLRCGLYQANGVTSDDFEAADLAAGPSNAPRATYHHLVGGMR